VARDKSKDLCWLLLDQQRRHVWSRPIGFRPLGRWLVLAEVWTFGEYVEAQQGANALLRAYHIEAVPVRAHLP
jgi:hypothetical protein